jgi:hypothetical protein
VCSVVAGKSYDVNDSIRSIRADVRTLPKSALKSSGFHRGESRVLWGRGHRTVQFQGSAPVPLVRCVARLSRICRVGCTVAGYWEALITVIITADFLLRPLHFVVEAVVLAKSNVLRETERLNTKQLDGATCLFYVTISLDIVFVMHLAFRVAQVRCH